MKAYAEEKGIMISRSWYFSFGTSRWIAKTM
jgi:hypothetical protein